LRSTFDLQQALNRLPVVKPNAEPDSELSFTISSHQRKKRSISHAVDLSRAKFVQQNPIQAISIVPVENDIASLPDSEYQEALNHLIMKPTLQLPPLPKEHSRPDQYSRVEDQLIQGLQHDVISDPPSKPLQEEAVYTFTFSVIFAGTPSFSEHAVPRGAKPISYVEWDRSDRLILQQRSEEAKVFGDFYKREWPQQDLFSEVIVAWPVCRHLSNAGRRKMHLDSVARR
jgi:hypothetical protein